MIDNELLVIGLLESMNLNLDLSDKSKFFHKYHVLRGIVPFKYSNKVLERFKVLLKALSLKFKSDKNYNIHVASVISLSYTLIPSEIFDQEMYEMLMSCMDLSDNRIKANALTAISEFDPESDLFKEHLNSKFNRIAAEALIQEGKKDLSVKVFARIQQFFSSPNPFFVASGIYVVDQLLRFWYSESRQEENFFKDDFHQLVISVDKLTSHPHEMIRKRALLTKNSGVLKLSKAS